MKTIIAAHFKYAILISLCVGLLLGTMTVIPIPHLSSVFFLNVETNLLLLPAIFHVPVSKIVLLDTLGFQIVIYAIYIVLFGVINSILLLPVSLVFAGKITRARMLQIHLTMLLVEVFWILGFLWIIPVAFNAPALTPYSKRVILVLTFGAVVCACLTGWLAYRTGRRFLKVTWRERTPKTSLRTAFVVVTVSMVGISAWTLANEIRTRRHTGTVEKRSKEKVVLIGIDGMEWSVIDELTAEGKLPHIQSLRQRGSSGRIRSMITSVSPVIWTTVSTGKREYQHGIYGFFNYDKPGYILNNSTDVKSRRIWDILSDVGYRVGVVNWYFSWPAHRVKGFLLSDRLQYSILDYRAFPDSLEQSLDSFVEREEFRNHSLARFTPYEPVEDIERFDVNYSDYQEDLFFHTFEMEAKRDLVALEKGLEFKAKTDPDLFVIYLRCLDAVSHLFWKYRLCFRGNILADMLYDLSPMQIETFGRIVDEYYIFMDEAIGRILETLDERTTVILMSDHGFGFRSTGFYTFNINLLLETLGLVELDTRKREILWDGTIVYENKVNISAKNVVKRLTFNFDGSGGSYDRPYTQDELRVIQNVKERLEDMSLTSGEPLFEDISESSVDNRTDLLVTINKVNAFFAHLNLDGSDIPCTSFLNYIGMSGMHRNDGVCILAGPHIKPHRTFLRSHMADITPTILYLFDLPVGRDMDGKPILPALEGYWKDSHRLAYIDSYEGARFYRESAFNTLGFEEKTMVSKEIKMQLQTLGYLQ
jgi:predicted AlkP superfamily phosphohydrolase/phosphomutase